MGKLAGSDLSTTLLPRILSLATCVGLAGGVWLAQVAIAPSAAQAYTARVDVTLDRRAGESYETLLRRAEIAARAAAQRGFDRDILATQVSVIVSAQSEGSVVPVLTLDVSRNQWRGRPDPQRWATYFRSSQALLNLQRLPGAEANDQVAPPPAPFVPSQPSSLPPAPPSTQIPPAIGVPSQTAPTTTNGGAGTGTTPAGAGTATPAGTGTTGTPSQPTLTTPGGQTITPPTQPAGTTPTGTQPTSAPTTGTGTTPTGTQPTNTPATGTGTTPAGTTQPSPTITTPSGQTTTVPTTQPGTTNNVPSNRLPSTTIR